MPYFIKVILYKLFYKHYIIKVINIIDKLINAIVIPQKHDKYTRKFFDGIGDGGGGWGEGKSDYKDCFRSQKPYHATFFRQILPQSTYNCEVIKNHTMFPSIQVCLQ